MPVGGSPVRPPIQRCSSQHRVRKSFTLLHRCVQILLAVFQSGDHCDLEQPRNALSWLEPCVQGYLLDIAADLVVVAACAFDSDTKHWLFATSWRDLQSLASQCPHPHGTHPPIHGVDPETGNFRSRHSSWWHWHGSTLRPSPVCSHRQVWDIWCICMMRVLLYRRVPFSAFLAPLRMGPAFIVVREPSIYPLLDPKYP